MSTASDALARITDKLTQIAQLISDAINAQSIKAERDEALAAISTIESQVDGIVGQIPTV